VNLTSCRFVSHTHRRLSARVLKRLSAQQRKLEDLINPTPAEANVFQRRRSVRILLDESTTFDEVKGQLLSIALNTKRLLLLQNTEIGSHDRLDDHYDGDDDEVISHLRLRNQSLQELILQRMTLDGRCYQFFSKFVDLSTLRRLVLWSCFPSDQVDFLIAFEEHSRAGNYVSNISL
jgi:hypothetical protein